MKNKELKGMDRLGKDPVFDWYFCLTCFLIAVVVVASGDLAIYLNVMSSSAAASSGISAPQTHIDQAEIEGLSKKLQSMDMDAASLSAEALRDPSTR